MNRKRIYKLQTHKLKLMVTRAEGWGQFQTDMYTLLFLLKTQITNKGLLYTTGNSAPCYVAASVGEKIEEEGIHVYIC